MTDPEIIKMMERLTIEMKESLDNMEKTYQLLKALNSDSRKYIDECVKERLK